MPGAKNWCFTLNNYEDGDVARLLALETEGSVAYCIFGREIGESGTPHLQGFIQFSSRKTRTAALALVGQAHFSVCRFVQKSIDYCKKEGNFSEVGTPPTSSAGQRTDLDAFKEDVVQGNVDLKSLRELHSEVLARFPRFCQDYVFDHIPKRVLPDHPLRPWQQILFEDLQKDPDARKVTFLVDTDGNSGKTWFSHWFVGKNVRPAQVLLPGKKADMAHTLDCTSEVIFIDAPRSKQGDYLQYDFLEEVKNGYVFCSKYESRLKHMPPCHVVVSMNEEPDLTKLSIDRYDIRRLDLLILNP